MRILRTKVKIKSPLSFDKEGNCIGWMESEIPLELICQLRWAMAHTLKNAKAIYQIPIFETLDDSPSFPNLENS
jgi:hypothetical protein